MTIPSLLPENLKNRLLAAGAKDEATLRAALEADPTLAQAYHQWLFSDGIHLFAAAQDRDALAALVEDAPFMLADDFMDAVQKTIDTALNMGEYDAAEALSQRLNALKQLRAQRTQQSQTPLSQAVIAFVQARSDIAARRVFERYQAELDTDEAETFLTEAFEGSSEAADRHLAQRQALLKALREEKSE